MAVRKIEKYVAGWHPERSVGLIDLYLDDGEKKRLRAETAPEFLAILKVLKDDEPVLTANGWISTGKEVPGGLQDDEE